MVVPAEVDASVPVVVVCPSDCDCVMLDVVLVPEWVLDEVLVFVPVPLAVVVRDPLLVDALVPS